MLDVFVVMLIIILAPAAVLSLAVVFVAFEAMWEDHKRDKARKKRRETKWKDHK